jgi:hypothetical protein
MLFAPTGNNSVQCSCRMSLAVLQLHTRRLSPSSYLQSRSAAASTLAGLGLHPDPSDPSWHRSLLAATSNASPTRHRPAGEGFTSASHTHLAGAYSARPVTATGTAIQDPVSPSSSSSSGSSSPSASPAGRVKKEKKRKEQGSAPAAGTAGGMPSTSPGVPTAAGGALGAVHPAVDEITRAARQISLQVCLLGCLSMSADVLAHERQGEGAGDLVV